MSSATKPPLSQSFFNNANNPLANSNSKNNSNSNSNTYSNNKTMATPASSSKKNVLRPVAVRERSKAIPGCKELKNTKDPYSSTISFLILPVEGEESKTEAKENKMPVRVTVFCDTGTIGTAKVLGGKVRQSFRRNVTSLDVLERLLRQPEGPVEINDQLIGVTDDTEDDDDSQDGNSSGQPNFKKGVELADVGLCILEAEREKLAKHLRHIDDEAEKVASEARAAAETQQQQLHQQQQQKLEEQRKLEAAKQKQQQQRQAEQQSAGEIQAQMLHQAMKSGNSQKGTGNRIGRRRNKLNNLRKNRHLNHSKKHLLSKSSSSATEMNKTKRRGGKQGAASSSTNDSSKRSLSKGTQAAASARLALQKIAGINDVASSYDDDSDHSDSESDSDESSGVSTPEYKRKVVATTTNNNSSSNTNTNINSFKNCGYEFHFKLPAEVMNQVDQCLRDIAKMNKVVKGVATNGRGTVFLYGNGGVAYTPAIPKALYQKLRQLRSSSFSSRPCFVALGTRDRYYVSFNDGSGDWKGSSSLDKMLKKRVSKNLAGGGSSSSGSSKRTPGGDGASGESLLPRSVAFGATYDTFFVVFNDGSWEYQGRSIPKSLEKKLRDRDDAADLVICNLGPNGEWFLKAENGKMWWSGISSELDSVLKKITRKGYLHNMDFGENGSYFVSYDEE
jgi:hypothetical protein